MNKRARYTGKEQPCENKYHLRKTNDEDVIYIISCCPFMSTRYTHLPITHDIVTKTLYNKPNVVI